MGFKDTRGTLFFDVIRIAKYHRPKIVLLENVKNIQRHDAGKTLKVVKQTIKKLEYEIHHQVLKSSYFGVPQARERIYFVCFRKDLKDESKLFKFPISSQARKPKTVKDILEKKVSSEYLILREDINFYRNEFEVTCPYSPLQIGKINKGGQGERIYSIHSSGITLSANGGGAAAKTGPSLVEGKVRKLTPRECLRMQGFPSRFQLPVTRNIAYKLLENSVSVPVIKAIFREINKIFIKRKYKD
jgi:DNA (cytosine-5)-methyltransferase 1